MKWTLLVLLIINVAFGGYQYWALSSQSEPLVQSSSTRFNNLELTAVLAKKLAQSSEKTPALQDSSSLRCIRISGLSEDDSLPVIESRLKALEVQTNRVKESVVLRRDYQVIAGPYNSIALARAELDKILAKGVESYVIGSGDNKNALSLGVFSNESNAKRKVDELQELGIVGNIIIKSHSSDQTNLIIDSKSASLISDSALDSMISAFKKVEFLRFQCN